MQPKSLVSRIWGVLSPMVIYVAVSFVVQLLAVMLSVSLYEYATEVTTIGAVCALPIFLYLFYKDRKRTDAIEESCAKVKWERYAFIALFSVAYALTINALLMMSNVMSYSEAYQEAATLLYTPSFPVQIICVGIIVPIVEEFMFRGLVYKRLRERHSSLCAILISALLFGLYHGNLVQMIYGALAGVALAYIYEKYGTIAAPVFTHIVMNVTSCVATEFAWFEWVFEDMNRLAISTLVGALVMIGSLMGISKTNVTKLLKNVAKI